MNESLCCPLRSRLETGLLFGISPTVTTGPHSPVRLAVTNDRDRQKNPRTQTPVAALQPLIAPSIRRFTENRES
jgi:hypothetical protein